VLDIGCGSGILSIAALKLGASTACGVDIDPQAITASRRNAQDNGVSEGLSLSQNLYDFTAGFDIVIANILAGTLIKLVDDISKRLVHGGKLALSGILAGQIDDVSSAYARWITFEPAAVKNNWVRLDGSRN